MQEQTIMQPKYGMNECMLVNRKSDFLLLFLCLPLIHFKEGAVSSDQWEDAGEWFYSTHEDNFGFKKGF